MKKILLLFLLFIPLSWISSAQTTLAPGDMAVLGFNFDNPDEWAFVPMVDLQENTEIKFTDNGWLSSGGFRSGEGIATWTAPTGGVSKGTVITINNDGGWATSLGSVVASGSLYLSGSGDQIIVYQGDDANPSVIFAINSEGTGWQADATNSNTSALPSNLTEGSTAIALNEVDNAVYNMSIATGTQTELLSAICNASNWNGDDGTRQTMPTTNLTINPGGADVTPPVWTTDYPVVLPRDDKAIVSVNMDEPGKAYAIVVANDATAPTSQEVKTGTDYGSVTVLAAGNVDVTDANKDFAIILSGLTAETSYDVWVVAEDDEATPNLQTSPVKLDVTTIATRTLTMTQPQDKDILSIGGPLHFEWTSQNIDSLYMGAYSYQENGVFIISNDNDQPIKVDASLGTFDFIIPHDADTGYYNIMLLDAADTSFYQSADSVKLMDNRKLDWLSPQDHDTYYVGDTVYFKWQAEYVDSIYIGGYDYSDSSFFMLPDEDNPMAIPASLDSVPFPIPLDANTDSVRLIIYDAADTSLHDAADPVYLIDTIKPRIAMMMPDNGKTDVPYTFTTVLAFDENITPLTGNIYLHKEDGSVIATVDVTSVQHEDNALSFSLPMTLDAGTTYYFTMDAGAVEDYRHNTFNGISNPDTWRFTTAAKQLYFSEYVEGSSNNKALEIFNPTDHAIDLSEYGIATTTNGSSWYSPTPLHGMLAAGKVYTIVNPSFDFSLLADSAAIVDTLWGQYVTWFSGDDARGLVQLVGGSWEDYPNYTLIDEIGEEGLDPGTGWDVAGTIAATKDHTLIRKHTVETGNMIIGWAGSAGTDAENSEWVVMPKDFVENLGYPSPQGSNRTDIISMVLRDTLGNLVSKTVTIDSANAVINIEVIQSVSTQIDSLVPVITAAPGATVVPVSGDTIDFTNPVVFTVTAEDGLTTRDWTITVTVAAAPSTETDILTFAIPNQIGNDTIDATNHTVAVEMPYKTDVTALVPALEVSAGASVSPASGVAQDFTNPVVYTVTAEDGTTTADWTVTVTVFEPPTVGIYDVQYTTDASGDSPYKGQMIRTSGIVTALNIYQSAFKGYFLQDTAAAWNGIYVYDPDHDTIVIGDSVTIVGTVDEYYHFTEVKNIQDLSLVSHGNTLPGPVELSSGDASSEKWESVFVTFHNTTCVDNNLGHGEVSVDDGSGALIVDDYLYQYDAANDFVVNNIYDLTGIMNYTYGAFKLNPRSADDISDVTGIDNAILENNVRIYPNPSRGIFYLSTEGMDGETLQVTVMNALGKVVYTKEFTNSKLSREQINLTGQARGFFFIRIESGSHAVVKRIIIQ